MWSCVRIRGGMTSVEERWVAACRDPQMLTGSVDYRLDFGLSFPGRWRGKSNFAPCRAALLEKVLGSDWYERIYNDPKSIWLTPERLKRWKDSTAISQTVRDNINRWLDNQDLVRRLSAVGWAKLLQAAYDFELMELFANLWEGCWKQATLWSADQQALLFQVY